MTPCGIESDGVKGMCQKILMSRPAETRQITELNVFDIDDGVSEYSDDLEAARSVATWAASLKQLGIQASLKWMNSHSILINKTVALQTNNSIG